MRLRLLQPRLRVRGAALLYLRYFLLRGNFGHVRTIRIWQSGFRLYTLHRDGVELVPLQGVRSGLQCFVTFERRRTFHEINKL